MCNKSVRGQGVGHYLSISRETWYQGRCCCNLPVVVSFLRAFACTFTLYQKFSWIRHKAPSKCLILYTEHAAWFKGHWSLAMVKFIFFSPPVTSVSATMQMTDVSFVEYIVSGGSNQVDDNSITWYPFVLFFWRTPKIKAEKQIGVKL